MHFSMMSRDLMRENAVNPLFISIYSIPHIAYSASHIANLTGFRGGGFMIIHSSNGTEFD